jgi:hypothetical protein
MWSQDKEGIRAHPRAHSRTHLSESCLQGQSIRKLSPRPTQRPTCQKAVSRGFQSLQEKHGQKLLDNAVAMGQSESYSCRCSVFLSFNKLFSCLPVTHCPGVKMVSKLCLTSLLILHTENCALHAIGAEWLMLLHNLITLKSQKANEMKKEQ